MADNKCGSRRPPCPIERPHYHRAGIGGDDEVIFIDGHDEQAVEQTPVDAAALLVRNAAIEFQAAIDDELRIRREYDQAMQRRAAAQLEMNAAIEAVVVACGGPLPGDGVTPS